MSEIAELVAEVQELGFKIEGRGGELNLVGKGRVSDELLDRLRRSKRDLLLYLRYGTEWETLCKLGSRLGETARVDGRDVTLWGVTPRGVIVDTGSFVITVDPKDVETE